MVGNYAIVKCAPCNSTHKCQINYDSAAFPTEKCKIVELLAAFTEYTCSKCKKTYQYTGNAVYHFVQDQYCALHEKYPARHAPKEEQEEWMRKWRDYSDTFFSEGGKEDEFFMATSKNITKDYNGFGFYEKEPKEPIMGYQIWLWEASYYDGDACSQFHCEPGTILCKECASPSIKDGTFHCLWAH